MKIRELLFWEFDQEPVEGCSILCPECTTWNHHASWDETDVGCECCGSHAALLCPSCDERFDHVWSPVFRVRPGGM